ncbi:hypothetical protein DVA67_028715 [Solirubrobacter sp. CPCC 204708]|uniref:Calcium-binding protein n=1 Tax=Solirubrobacter deserti TaxID=2282478 RepID=A0ABT4RPC9_9ACTN|nr:hypothetical protein [Solirubrobacter deserti]MBE2319981.1 hypothetical protein [Solirubrobacter deserti]MDA0140422.1 hypothetical protein [Solirubrobacter deserti]
MRTRSWATSLITTSLVVAAPAHAGTITLEDRTWVFTAAPGERNRITVESVPGGVRLRDTAVAPTGCPADGPDAVICTGAVLMTVRAGDGDDRVEARGTALVAVDGGAGDDLLLGDAERNDIEGGPGDDHIRGRGGPDQLDGGRGHDRVLGGAGNDTLEAMHGNDRLDGGPGNDGIGLSFTGDGVVRCGSGRDRIDAIYLFGDTGVRGTASGSSTRAHGCGSRATTWS